MPIMSSIGRRFARSQKPATGYLYYRWRITNIRIFSIANSVQASEFVFQSGGVDTRPTATVTNPGGSNPAGEQPANLYDNNLTTKALDLILRARMFLYFYTLFPQHRHLQDIVGLPQMIQTTVIQLHGL